WDWAESDRGCTMKWSWKIGSVRGIAVYLHTTFLLLLAWIGIGQLAAGHTLLGAVGGVLFVLLLFACVVLHEFGHALTAQRFGIQPRDITLYPIGGIARLQRIPRNPRQELLIALAGPAVNVAIAVLLAFILLASGRPLPAPEGLALTGGSLAGRLLLFNLWI